MKLLLTSQGLTNTSIRAALEELASKPTRDLIIAFVPTSNYGENHDKTWFVKELNHLHGLGWKEFRIIEITALSKEKQLEWFDEVDVIYFIGGNSYFLRNRMESSGFTDILPELLKSKVYVGSSAGSVVMSSYSVDRTEKAFGSSPKNEEQSKLSGLGYINAYLRPHLNNTKEFPERTMDWAEKSATKADFPFYVLDDNSAIKVEGDKVEVVSEGVWKLFNG